MKISCNGYVLMAFIFGNIFHKSFVKHVVAHENAAGNEQFFQIRVKFGVLPLRPVHKNEVVALRQHRNYFAGIAFKKIHPVRNAVFAEVFARGVGGIRKFFNRVERRNLSFLRELPL